MGDREKLTHPESSVNLNIKSFISVGVTSWSRRNTTPRSETRVILGLVLRIHLSWLKKIGWVGLGWIGLGWAGLGSLVTAKSLIISSPHFMRSFTWRPSYSRPKTGVRSWCWKLSSVPVYFRGFSRRVRACTLPPKNWPSSRCSAVGSSTDGMIELGNLIDRIYILKTGLADKLERLLLCEMPIYIQVGVGM